MYRVDCKVGNQINIPTILTLPFNYVSGFDRMCCVEDVNNLVNRPVECLFDTRMNGTSTQVVTQSLRPEGQPGTSNHKPLEAFQR